MYLVIELINMSLSKKHDTNLAILLNVYYIYREFFPILNVKWGGEKLFYAATTAGAF